jgi:quercetin dioxygenase-like cupin family protein
MGSFAGNAADIKANTKGRFIMSKSIVSAVVLLIIIASPAASQEGTAKPDPPLLKELSKEFPKGDELEARVMTATLKPGMTSPWHTHAAPVIVYVLEGTLTLETDGGPKSLEAGKAALEPISTRMRAANSLDKPVKVLIVQISDPKEPFMTPVQ